MTRQFLWLLLIAAAYPWTVGCKSLDFSQANSESTEESSPWWKKDELPPAKLPAKIVAIWASSVFNEPGQGPTRGLGGRVYFYDSKHQPVRVDGKLAVFLYDDTEETDQDQQEASKKVHFSAEEVAASYTPTEFGPSYSFWVPWDEVGGEQTHLSVIPVFTAGTGEMIVGKQARYLLPGKKNRALAKKDDKETRRNGVVLASFEEQGTTQGEQGLKLKSSIIKVPSSVQDRLKRSPGNREQRRANRSAGNISTIRNRESRMGDTILEKENRDERETILRDRLGQTIVQRPGTFGRRPGVVRVNGDLFSPTGPAPNGPTPNGPTNGTEESETTTGLRQQPTTGSQLGLRQAQAVQSAQQASVRDRNLLDRARSLFAR